MLEAAPAAPVRAQYKEAMQLLQLSLLTAPACLCRWWLMRCSSGRLVASTPPRKRVRGMSSFERVVASVRTHCRVMAPCLPATLTYSQ